jgi:putative polyhydroxyalkanoate system protein
LYRLGRGTPTAQAVSRVRRALLGFTMQTATPLPAPPTMSTIDIRAQHTLGTEQAQQAADELCADLAEKFQVDYGWDGDCIVFERPGVNGEITVTDREIHVQARVGLMLMFLRGPIEQEIHRYLSERFGCTVC